jgi:hypothetical protein
MLSSLNAFSGLSAANLLTLLGANSSSSSSSTSTSAVRVASTGVSVSGAGDPAKAIKAILAQAQMGTPGGGSVSTFTAEAAYSAQMGGSSSLFSASVTISSPGALQQIADAVSEINYDKIFAENGDVSNPITVTAADAVNFTISDGAATMTAMQGYALPSELPSLASIQQAYHQIISENQAAGAATSYDGSFTLVKLPLNSSGGGGPNSMTFSASGSREDDIWQLVLTQASVGVTVSDTQIKG